MLVQAGGHRPLPYRLRVGLWSIALGDEASRIGGIGSLMLGLVGHGYRLPMVETR